MKVETPLEQLFFTTLLITSSSSIGASTGTGFILEHTIGENRYLFVVTNKHVISEAERGEFFFTEESGGQPVIGSRIDVKVDSFANHWHGHPDDEVDIAVLPLAPVLNMLARSGKRCYFRAIPTFFIPSLEQIYELDAIEDIMFIGYPNGMYDEENLIPVVRRGTTATPLQLDYNGQPAFLIDASVFPGSSGSPVIYFSSGGFNRHGNFVVGAPRGLLLGVMARVFMQPQAGVLQQMQIPTGVVLGMTVNQMIDIGFVFKARTIVETIDDFFATRV